MSVERMYGARVPVPTPSLSDVGRFSTPWGHKMVGQESRVVVSGLES